MPVIAKGKEFELCPAGLYPATVVKVTPFEHESWGERVRFTFETDQIGKEGQTLSVFHEASLNLSPKAKLSGIVEDLLGRPITPEERKNGFDIDSLVGITCQVNVKHRFSQTGNEYALVDAVITGNGNGQQSPTSTTAEDHNDVDADDEFVEANAELQVTVEDDIPF